MNPTQVNQDWWVERSRENMRPSPGREVALRTMRALAGTVPRYGQNLNELWGRYSDWLRGMPAVTIINVNQTVWFSDNTVSRTESFK